MPSLANGGLVAAFHPAGTLLASNDWKSRLRLWDPASGRERLSLTCGGAPAFSKDGRIFVRQGNEFSLRQVDPAAEYTTLSYASSDLLNHARASIHRDGRLLAVGTDRGVILWDLARKTELGFLPIGNAWHSMFEPSGDLLTNGSAGVLRWAIQEDPTSGEVRIGPPRSLPLRGTDCGIAFDRTGQIVAVAGHQDAQVVLGDRTITIGPLDDCRGVSLSPDGKWLLTNSHANGGVMLWSLPDRARVPNLPFEVGGARFSPDGKWLVSSTRETSRICEVGNWREVRQFDGFFQSFSPDGRLGIVLDTSNVLRLVEIETGRILARLERPDQQALKELSFSPDGSRLVGTTNDPPSVQVIDLRAIRRGLAEMGLDWDAPAFSEDDPARADLPPLPPIKVDYGHLGPDAVLIQLLAGLDTTDLKKLEPAIVALETALAGDPSNSEFENLLATCCNNLAWGLAANSPSSTNLDRALKLSLRAVELEPGKQVSLNTRGVVLYRARQFADAVTVLEKSLEAGKGRFDGFDLFFLAMAHHRLGHRAEARRCLDRAIDWTSHRSLSAQYAKELAAFRAEAESVLAGPIGELPDDVFEEPTARTLPSPR